MSGYARSPADSNPSRAGGCPLRHAAAGAQRGQLEQSADIALHAFTAAAYAEQTPAASTA
ncbi:hypothetical protein OG799_17315 [Micromonospora sp. NBC_00898]|uniref:hypothetical protein n=1 Tax=Micromonospora sp. NBC_00898 TaxID=2975981 RepID=UPI0038656E3B|nr:hypothetical protein OG799_17315 [Micromonospora sp. NBC_00898]